MAEEEEKKRKRVSWIITGGYVTGVILVLLLCGLKYQDPPPQTGLEMADFGTDDQGQGNVEEIPEDASSEAASNPDNQMTDDESPVKTKKEDEVKKKDPKKDTPKKDPKVDGRLKKDAFKNPKKGGDGNDGQDGNTGTKDGAKDGNAKDGAGSGSFGGGNWKLSGRGAMGIPKPPYKCSGQGKVVVKVWVNRAGSVTKAAAGQSGSTTSSACLYSEAEAAAKKAKFTSKDDANDIQIGYITYVFKLN